MLNIGFGEMVVIAGACLIVIGPKRLPATARFIGHLYARLVRQATSVRSEIRKEIELEDMRREMRATEDAARQVGREIREPVEQIAAKARLEIEQHPEDPLADEKDRTGGGPPA